MKGVERMRSILTAGCALALLTGSASAVMIPLGYVSEGGVAVHYNTTGSEAPENQSYLQAQYSQANSNGAEFQFDPDSPAPSPGFNWNSEFSGQPVGSSQFGLDMVLPMPTADGSAPPPVLNAVDYTQGGQGSFDIAGPVDWAINDYKFGSPSGSQNAANVPHNSLFRSATSDGSSIAVSQWDVDLANGIYTATIAGTLMSDGFIHWYGSTGTTALMSWGLEDYISFSGVLSYDSRGDDGTDRVDFYAGRVDLFVHTKAVPESGATLALISLSLACVALVRRFT